MKELDLEEQEQLEELKAWWKQNSTWIVTVLAILAAAIASYRGWQYYEGKQGQEAAQLYFVLQNEASAGDVEKVRALTGQIMDKYPRTPFASSAAMEAAKLNYGKGDAKSAKAQLQWVIDHAKDNPTKDLARLKLAGVFLDEKDYAESLKLLDTKHDEAFATLYDDMKGDVYFAQGKLADARDAYKSAISKAGDKSAYRKYIQIKLDSLGDQG